MPGDGKVETIKDYTDFLNGLTGTGKWLKRTYTYDRLNRPTGIIYTDSMSGSSTAVKQSHIYTYDKNSNITSEDVIDRYGTANSTYYGQRRDYSYDVNDRLTVSSISRRTAEDAMSAAESHYYSYDAAGNKTSDVVQRQRSGSVELISNKYYTYNKFNQLTAVDGLDMESGSLIGKTYAYDENGNQISETDQEAGKQTVYEYDADNRLRKATGRTGETVDYVQENKYNGFGQRVQKKEGSDVTAYFYDGSTVLYTEDAQDKVTSFNLIGAENNILQTARAGQDDAVNFYTYTKDLRESTINIVGATLGAYDGYKYAKKKKLKGWKKAAAIVGGATLGAVNPFKVVKVAKTGYKAYKAAKYTKTAVSTVKKSKTVVKVVSKAKPVIVAKKTVRVKAKPRVGVKSLHIATQQKKKIGATIKVEEYKDMKKITSVDGQAHHLSQDAAFRDVIPTKKGLTIELKGNAITDVESPHYRAHASLEKFWNQYRINGEFQGKSVKIGDYNKAVYDSLVEAGISKPDAAYAVRRAYMQQRYYGLINSGFVPRIPGRLNQVKP